MTHDADRLIRQLSLVAYLMAEQRPVTARDVKLRVEGYANMGDEAFARRFYADRSELQGLGVPIASVRDEFTSEELYSLREEQYFLPPVELAIRDWARRDDGVARRLKRMDNRRLDYMRTLFAAFADDDADAEVRCLLAFALFVGHPLIAGDHPGRTRREVRDLALAHLLR